MTNMSRSLWTAVEAIGAAAHARDAAGIPARARTFAATMRSFALLLGCATLLACAGGRGEVSPPAATPEPSPVAAPTPAPAPAPTPAPAEPADASARLLAEVRAMAPADRWSWAVTAMPELAGHREIGASDPPFAEFRAAQRERTTLWVRPRGERCFAVRGAWDEHGFAGRGRETTTIDGAHKTVRFESIDIGEYGISASGPHGDEYTRDARGRWRLSGGFGIGSGQQIAARTVSAVERGAAYYGGHVYTVTIACGAVSHRDDRCSDGTKRRCSRCSELTARRHSADVAWASSGTIGVTAPGAAVDCSQPCPPDDLGEKVAALNLAVEGRRFLGADEPVAAVYADARACRSDRRMRAAPPDGLLDAASP